MRPIAAVTAPFIRKEKRRTRARLSRSRAKAVVVASIMRMGDSATKARASATPNAPRLYFGSGSLATSAATNGPSAAIINHVAARGSQNRKIETGIGMGSTILSRPCLPMRRSVCPRRTSAHRS